MYEYTTSSFGLNIPTGLMLESILAPTTARIDDEREVPNKVDLSEYKEYYINVLSFISCVIGSYDKDTVDALLLTESDVYSEVYTRIEDEMIVLARLLPIPIVYYVATYKKYDKADLLKTLNASTKVGLKQLVMDTLLDSLYGSTSFKILTVDGKLPLKGKTLMSTSNALDLLNDNVKRVDLLEFHTGLLKRRNKFYTKLKTDVPIPFEESTVLYIGDKNGIVVPKLMRNVKKQFISNLSEKTKSFERYSKGFLYNIAASTLTALKKDVSTLTIPSYY